MTFRERERNTERGKITPHRPAQIVDGEVLIDAGVQVAHDRADGVGRDVT